MNCWDYKQCPEERRSQCPAYLDDEGDNCWLVIGTLCEGRPRTDLNDKVDMCSRCEFRKSNAFTERNRFQERLDQMRQDYD